MAVYLCHEQPDLYEHEATVAAAAPGRVLFDRSAFHPGGGGQLGDTGWVEHAGGVVAVAGVDPQLHGAAQLDRFGEHVPEVVAVRLDAGHRHDEAYRRWRNVLHDILAEFEPGEREQLAVDLERLVAALDRVVGLTAAR